MSYMLKLTRARPPTHRARLHICTRASSKSHLSEEELALWEQYFAQDEEPHDVSFVEPPNEVDGDGARPGFERFLRCYGCGIQLQADNPDRLGYVDPVAFQQKVTHRQRGMLLCSRCIALTHGKMVPAVEDFAVKQKALQSGLKSHGEAVESPAHDSTEFMFKGERLMTPEQLREQLKVIRDTRSVCVLVIDILDAAGSFLKRVRNLVGKNPIVVIASKVDLLPRGTDEELVLRWLEDYVAFTRLTVLSVHLVSNRTGTGMEAACAAIRESRCGRDIYIIGAANVGKSAFVRRFVRELADVTSRNFAPSATAASRRLPVESSMPGTTLGLVRVGAFPGGTAMYDTPGLHLSHRIIHYLRPEELKAIHPKRRLRPYVAASPRLLAENDSGSDAESASVVPSGTYFWGGCLRCDVMCAPGDVELVFFGTGALQVYSCSLLGANDMVELDKLHRQEFGTDGILGAQSVASLGGLRLAREIDLEATGSTTTLADICLSGMPGWLSVVSQGSPGSVRMRIWVPKGVEVNLRPPIPCPTPLNITTSCYS